VRFRFEVLDYGLAPRYLENCCGSHLAFFIGAVCCYIVTSAANSSSVKEYITGISFSFGSWCLDVRVTLHLVFEKARIKTTQNSGTIASSASEYLDLSAAQKVERSRVLSKPVHFMSAFFRIFLAIYGVYRNHPLIACVLA
jgi:hypothetical protein